jgi:ribulose-5-phosphate 4-epimerase/fuculose-1-phosphate aldolase
VLGKSGTFSALVSRHRFCMAITATGLDKGSLTPEQIVQVDANGAQRQRPRGSERQECPCGNGLAERKVNPRRLAV